MPAPWNAHAVGTIHGTIHGQETVNVMHFATNANITDQPFPHPLLLELAQALLECAVDTLLPAVTQDWTLVKTRASFVGTVIPTLSPDFVEATAPAASVGELSSTSVSFAASGVDLKTGRNGRNGRGRMFLPPAGEAEMSASGIDNATLLLIAAFLTCMAGKFLGASPSTVWRWGVYSRKLGGASFANFDAAFAVIGQSSPRANSFVIGRRKVGRGD